MSDNQYQNQKTPLVNSAETAQTSVGGGSGENETNCCCSNMMIACKDLCNRFMSARLGISYDISTRIKGGEGQGLSQEQQSNNVMTKQGEMEIRMSDLAIGAVVTCAFMSVMCAVKRMCCCKGKRKC